MSATFEVRRYIQERMNATLEATGHMPTTAHLAAETAQKFGDTPASFATIAAEELGKFVAPVPDMTKVLFAEKPVTMDDDGNIWA